MDNQLYEEIVRDLEEIGGLNVNDRYLCKLSVKYSEVSEDTLRSIIGLWNQRKVSKISYRLKDYDVYNIYKSIRMRGNISVCQQLAKDFEYPPSLIAKIVVAGYAQEMRAKNRLKVQDAKSLRKQECSWCKSNKTFNLEKKTIEIQMLENVSIAKKHNDPRVELALNLFDEEDEIGKYFVEMFNFQSNAFTGEFKSVNEDLIQSPLDRSSREELAYRTLKGFNNLNVNDICTEPQKEKAFFSNNVCSFNSNITCNITNSEFQDLKTKLLNDDECTCSPEIDSDNTDSDSDYSDEECEYSVKELLENTSLIDDPVLAADVLFCILSDDQYGPTSDIIGHSSGITFELLLEQHVKDVGLSYKTENKLRGFGVDKTPDIMLQVPVAVNNFVINWIESKALFADYRLHQELKKNQYKNYINRFGPGLVIYWRGYVADLPDLYLIENKQILVRDNFPPKESFTFMRSNEFRELTNRKGESPHL